MRYAIVIETAGAKSRPTFPSCLVASQRTQTLEATEQAIREAIEFHLDGLREDGAPIPPPQSRVQYVEVVA
jgi:predicted RNase H-like HicB family nuclease